MNLLWPQVAESMPKIPSHRRILQLTSPGRPEIVSAPISPLEPDQVLVQVSKATPKLGTEAHNASGGGIFASKTFNHQLRLFEDRDSRSEERYPIPVGNQIFGKIVEIGSAVEKFSIGDSVVGWGPISDFHTASEGHLIPIGQLSWKRAFLLDPGQFALGGLIDGGVKKGDNLLVTGAGPIGLLTIAMAVEMGAKVRAACKFEEGRQLAEKFGAIEVIDPDETELGRHLKENVKSRDGQPGVDIAIECSGKIERLGSCVRSVRQRGTVVVVSFYQDAAAGWFPGEEAFHNAITIRFSLPAFKFQNPVFSDPPMGPAELKEKVHETISALNSPVEEILRREFKFGAEAARIFADLADGIRNPNTIKPSVSFDT